MSDFLTNLVARNLEPATEIKPRLASLYEPPQPVGGVLYGPAGEHIIGPESPFERGLQETTEALRGQSLERNQQTRRFPSRLQYDDASDASIHERLIETTQPPSSSISPASAEQRTNWSINQHSQTPAKSPSQDPSSQTVSPPIVPTSQNEGQPRDALETSKLIPMTTPREAHTGPVIRATAVDERDASAQVAPAQEGRLPSSQLQTDASRQRVRAMEAEHSINRNESDGVDHRSAGQETRPAITGPITPRLPGQDVSERELAHAPAGVFVRPQVTRKTEPDPPARDAAPTETAQTINVTIGRIEVRATAANESRPRPQQKQTPTTSLDEYLRQRAQGVKR